MVEITLFEIHLDGAQLDANAEALANAPGSGLRRLIGRDGSESASEPTDTAAGDESGRGPSLVKSVLSVLGLAVAAVAVRRALDGRGPELQEEADEEAEIAEIGVGK